MKTFDTIVAPITSAGHSAVAVIRLSGNQSLVLLSSHIKGDVANWKSHTLHYHLFFDGEKKIDEVVISYFKNPTSYTKEDVVEIACHGSPVIVQQILESLIRSGARMALPGEFTQRAFLNGRFDLSQAEAVADLIAAENEAMRRLAFEQMRGGVSTELKNLREELITLISLLELELDFSEEDVEFANRKQLHNLLEKIQQHVRTLLDSFQYGNAVKHGVPTAIVGKPNAGKSSLLNALLNDNRAIVSPIAGTTRDTIEEKITLEGITFRFIDTAGLRKSDDVIEQMGIERTKEAIDKAQLILYLFDVQDTTRESLANELSAISFTKRLFICPTKIDLHASLDFDTWKKYLTEKAISFEAFIPLTVKENAPIEKIKHALVQAIQQTNLSATVITHPRHYEALQRATVCLQAAKQGMDENLSGDLLAYHLRDAAQHIGSITGVIDFDSDILGAIFSRFCIGK